ncbi:MAG TPA: hypothetical protein VNI60_09335 [Pyrinomonadaceae bacterium]|nr:hypothetical protein [Pyrinomonadaceae bacterium]
MSEEIEIIDSTNMEILSEFPVEYDEDELKSPSSTNIKNYFIKASDRWIVFTANSKGSDEAVGDVAFERSSFKQLSQELEAVLAGKLYEEKLDALIFENGRDKMIISATRNLPLNQFAWVNRVNVSNLREIELDEIEYGSLSLPVEAARKLHREMQRLISKGKI